MTYHPTDSDDDGTVEADVDNTNTDAANLGNNGSAVSVGDDLDLQSNQEVKNASAVSTDKQNIKSSTIQSITIDGDSSATLSFEDNNGLLIVSKVSGGSESGLYLIKGGEDSVEKVGGSSTFVNSAPSSDEVGVYHDGSDYILEDNDSGTFEVTATYVGR